MRRWLIVTRHGSVSREQPKYTVHKVSGFLVSSVIKKEEVNNVWVVTHPKCGTTST